MMHSDRRQQVLDAIAEVMQAAEDAGHDSREVARKAFPGVPDGVLAEVEANVMLNNEERWLRWAARTMIDGEAQEMPKRKGLAEPEIEDGIPF